MRCFEIAAIMVAKRLKLSLNNNMRCFEMRVTEKGYEVEVMLNNNMRCFEMIVNLCFVRCKFVKQ